MTKTFGPQGHLYEAFELLRAGNFELADKKCRHVLTGDPHNRDARHLLAMIAFRRGDPETAAASLRALAAEFPNHAAALNDLGLVLTELERYSEAEGVLVRAINLRPGVSGFRLNLANVYKKQFLLAEAEQQVRAAISHKRDYADAYLMLSEIYSRDGRTEDAVKAAEQACRLTPNDPRSLVRLAEALDEANPAVVTGATKPDQRSALAERLETLLARPDQNEESRALLHFALVKVYEDLKDYPKAFGHSLQGNALMRKKRHYSDQATGLEFDNIKCAVTPALISRLGHAGFEDDTPIFVLGMPRSGTTLTEQILASHNGVHGAGELKLFHCLVGELRARLGACTDTDLAGAAKPEDWRALGEAYVMRLRRTAPEARHIVDKMPGNFRHLGYIRLALPKAKVIYCKRWAPDNCVSIFNLQLADSGMGYGYDLTELGGYYRKHAELMRHWQDVMPGFFLTSRYEDLVADQEAQTRKILEFCGLDWDDNVLTFFANTRAVHTASLAQVRLPIYKSSVGRYKHFGPAVQPLLDALDWDEETGDIRL